MRGALHILVLFAVLWCGLHFCEPAEAHADSAQPAMSFAAQDEVPSLPAQPDSFAHAGHHHHCPVAPDRRDAPLLADQMPRVSLLFAAPPAALASLSQAPPTEPPAA